MIPDAELLRRYAHEQSETAFAELVRRQVDLVHSVARRLTEGDEAAAQDITQGVFISLALRARELCQRRSLTGWLHRKSTSPMA